MKMKTPRQSGLTLIGFLIVLCVCLFFAYAAMRLIPMYLEFHALTNAMKLVQQSPQSSQMSPYQIRERITRSLWTSYATDNIKRQDIKISKKSDGVNVRVAYEVRKPFLGNISLVASFDHTVVLR